MHNESTALSEEATYTHKKQYHFYFSNISFFAFYFKLLKWGRSRPEPQTFHRVPALGSGYLV